MSQLCIGNIMEIQYIPLVFARQSTNKVINVLNFVHPFPIISQNFRAGRRVEA
jgi:hypothetical protein